MVSRPAIVLTPKAIGPGELLLWALMVTNAARPGWPGDIAIPDAEGLGLLVPSKVRSTKIAAVETSAATKLGRLDGSTWKEVRESVRTYLGF